MALTPYLSTITNSTVNQDSTSLENLLGNASNSTMSQFTPGQQALQGQSLGFIGNLLSGGQLPGNFGLPKATRDAAWFDFNNRTKFDLASRYGAGSPAIGSAAEQLNLKLAGLGGQMAMPQALDAYRMAADYAFRPIGQIGTAQDSQKRDITQGLNRSDTQTNIGEIIATLLSAIAGGGV